jgi:DNA-binding Lrp family transcriptional regulator
VKNDADQKRKLAIIRKLTTRTDELLIELVDEYAWTHLLPVLDIPVTIKPPRTHPFSNNRQLAARTPTERYALDDTDKALLPHVITNPCGSYMALARESSLSHETVRLRFRKWLAAGLLLGVGAVPDYSKFGYFANFLLVKANDDAARIGRALKELSFVFYAARMKGDFDYLIYTYDHDPREFAEHAQTIRTLFTKLERIELFVFDRIHSYRQFPMDALA